MLTPSLCYAGIDKSLHASASAVAETVLVHNKPFCKWKPWQRSLFNVVIYGNADRMEQIKSDLVALDDKYDADYESIVGEG